MDTFGVPKKVNRHVIKAIYKLGYQKLGNPNLSNICDSIKFTMRNNVPIPNLLSVVREALQNLHKLGVIEKQGMSYNTRIYQNMESFPPILSKPVKKRMFKKVRNGDESTLDPNNRKRKVVSEDSIPENDPKSSIKRFRTSKTLSRKGVEVDLPKVRRNINYQLSHSDEKEQYWCSIAENNSKNDVSI